MYLSGMISPWEDKGARCGVVVGKAAMAGRSAMSAGMERIDDGFIVVKCERGVYVRGCLY